MQPASWVDALPANALICTSSLAAMAARYMYVYRCKKCRYVYMYIYICLWARLPPQILAFLGKDKFDMFNISAI